MQDDTKDSKITKNIIIIFFSMIFFCTFAVVCIGSLVKNREANNSATLKREHVSSEKESLNSRAKEKKLCSDKGQNIENNIKDNTFIYTIPLSDTQKTPKIDEKSPDSLNLGNEIIQLTNEIETKKEKSLIPHNSKDNVFIIKSNVPNEMFAEKNTFILDIEAKRQETGGSISTQDADITITESTKPENDQGNVETEKLISFNSNSSSNKNKEMNHDCHSKATAENEEIFGLSEIVVSDENDEVLGAFLPIKQLCLTDSGSASEYNITRQSRDEKKTGKSRKKNNSPLEYFLMNTCITKNNSKIRPTVEECAKQKNERYIMQVKKNLKRTMVLQNEVSRIAYNDAMREKGYVRSPPFYNWRAPQGDELDSD
ncbi:hypothetical protein EDEG_02846 [Edhazardia aedis USNM 41457]|uniref:Uncharacterized protein n=1 Tax=Edhazardia aedis (strain USNM 41457) TaxID=1003232 RepID=J8ZSW1_EDHAE|nr:hypothetical protein EDEG_02846 [Edhazardia aedis USNM 41457]|eukprot:EJW02753.1 hypothetical protein EDEG_02846 [Edhazardia aedis USNM 41457]